MGKYKFIYCKKCDEFYLNWSTNFTTPPKKACPNFYCLSMDVIEFEADSFQEMAQIERQFKIKKISGIKN
jgi:hypothetical protein